MPTNGHPKKRTCGAMDVHQRLLRTVPGYREARDAIENEAMRSAFYPIAGRTGCTKIPVVVHVVYKTNAQNIWSCAKNISTRGTRFRYHFIFEVIVAVHILALNFLLPV
jgi:hypothetical protein